MSKTFRVSGLKMPSFLKYFYHYNVIFFMSIGDGEIKLKVTGSFLGQTSARVPHGCRQRREVEEGVREGSNDSGNEGTADGPVSRSLTEGHVKREDRRLRPTISPTVDDVRCVEALLLSLESGRSSEGERCLINSVHSL